MATHSEINQKFQKDNFVLRTVEVHEYHLQCVQHNKENAALYGANGKSSFVARGYFEVKSLPPHIMHDMLEGVFPLTLKHVTCEAYKNKSI